MSEQRQTIAEKIVDYMRVNQAFHNSSGIELSGIKLAKIWQLSSNIRSSGIAISMKIKDLAKASIILLKSGRIGQGNWYSYPPYYVLAQEYEQGDSWKTTALGIVATTPSTASDVTEKPRKRRTKVQGDVELAKTLTECLTKLNQARVDNNNLREQLLTALEQKETLEAKNKELQSEVDELKTSEHQASVDLLKAHQEINQLISQNLAEEKREIRLTRQILNYNR